MPDLQRVSARHEFDIWNEVPLVPQLTGMSCWAAAAAMIIGWRDVVDVDPEQVATGAGRWAEYRDGLQPVDLTDFARAWRLTVETKLDWSVSELRDVLERYGPIWVGEASPGLHSIVITGCHGDGTADGTFMRVNDPWPIGRGERYTLTWRRLMENFRNATSIAGVHAQLLHAGGRRGGRSGTYHFEQKRVTRHFVTKIPPSKDVVMPTTQESSRHHEEYPFGFGSAVAYATSTIAAGERYVDTSAASDDPLAGHGGTDANLYLVWNQMPSEATAIDIVVHLHGYSSRKADDGLLRAKVAASGLNVSGRSRPTLGIVPRGRKISDDELKRNSKANASRYTFPALLKDNGGGLERLVAFALEDFTRNVLAGSGATLQVDRVILTAHSGGGAPLNRLLTWHNTRTVCNPHEVHVFDGLYGDVKGVIDWVDARINADGAIPTDELPARGGALRIAYRAGEGTQAGSRSVASHLPKEGGRLWPAYRAEATKVPHGDIPRSFGWTLLTDVRAELIAPATTHGLVARPQDWESARALAVDDDARAWLAADATGRAPLDASVATWIAAIDRSAIELIDDAAVRKHYREDVDWAKQHFSGRGSNTAESEALFREIAKVVPERRVPTGINYRDMSSVVVPVPGSGGHKLHPEAKDSFVSMRAAAKSEGIDLTIKSSYRSAERQAAAAKQNPNPAAVAQGVSAHMYGLAIDVKLSVPGLVITEISTRSMPNMVAMYRSPTYKWLALHAHEHGWFPYRREPWHWEYNPPGFKQRFESGRSASATASSYGAPVGVMEKYQPVIVRDRPSLTQALQAVPNWCDYRQNVVRIALREEARWTRPDDTKIVESDDAESIPILTEYWRTVPDLGMTPAQNARHSADDEAIFGPWSAAFICFVMHEAGVRAAHGFDFSRRHLNYVVSALRNRERSQRNRPFWLVDSEEIQAEAIPEPGDLICLNRGCGPNDVMTHHTYTSLRNDFWSNGNENAAVTGCSHCALVLGIGHDAAGDFVETIGGNEAHSVRRNGEGRIALNANGGIVIPGANAPNNRIFGMIKMIGCDQ